MHCSLTIPTVAALGVVLGAGSVAQANIDIELRPVSSTVMLGDQAEIGVYLVSDDLTTQFSSAATIILTWDTTYLSGISVDDSGGYPLLSSGFPTSTLNDSFADGDAFYQALASFTDDIPADPAGTLITTLVFDTLQVTPGTTIDIPITLAGEQTIVFDGLIPNFDVLGTANGATIAIVIPAPPALIILAGGCGLLAPRRRRRAER